MIIFRPKNFSAEVGDGQQQATTKQLSPSAAAANQRSQLALQRTNMVTQRQLQEEGMKQQRLNMTMMRMAQQNSISEARAKQRQGMQNQRLAVQRQLATERNLAKLKAAEKEEKVKNVQLFKRPSVVIPPVPMKN